MIKIERLRLHNFKSFRKANIPFSQGFTAIVGPNASGKSNILDSLLFVLGITSLKMLRAGRLTELVNHDSPDGIAKVEVELRDNDRVYTIARTIDKQGKSVCRLDGKRKGLNEISALLLELGVKADGHNIVAQGDITSIIEMSAKQRREVVDAVAGLQEFEDKKEEALKKLEKVQARIKDANLVLNEREKQLGELEKDREAALRYQKLEEELKRSKATIVSEEIKRIRTELGGAKRKMEGMENEIRRREKEKEQLTEEERQTDEKLEAVTAQLIKSSEETYSTIGRDVEKKRAEIRIVNERMHSQREQAANYGERVNRLRERKGQLESQIKEKSEAAKKKEFELKETEEMLRPFEKSAEEKARKLKELGNAFRVEEARLSELGEDINGKQQGFYEKEALIREAKKEIALLGEEAEKLEKEKSDLKVNQKIDALNSFEKKLELTTGKLQGINAELKAMKETKKGLRTEIEGIQEKICSIMEIGKSLSEEVRGLKSFFEALAEKKKLEEYREKIKNRNAALIGVEQEKKLFSDAIKGLAAKRQETCTKIRELRSAVDELSGLGAHEKVEKLRERKAALRNELTAISTEITQYSKNSSETEEEIAAVKRDIEKAEKNIELAVEEEKKLNEELAKKEAELDKATESSKLLAEKKARIETKLRNIADKKEALEKAINQKEREINEFNLSLSKNEVRLVDLEQEFQEFSTAQLLKAANITELKKRIAEIEKEIDSLGAINMKALESFEGHRREVEEMREKTGKLDEERIAVLGMIEKIEVKKIAVFMECFNQIGRKFSELYYSFFGGEGKLGLSNQENPLEGGLLIEAKYKENKLKSIDAMSGGEKSLTALAFMFAIQSFEPAPFYVFDEADAALDKENSLKIARMIKGMSDDNQFIAITHNDSLIKEADQLIGVALNREKSSVIGLKLKQQAAQNAASAAAAPPSAQLADNTIG